MSSNENITEKVYKKLILEISLDGFSFAIQDTLLSRIETVKNIVFTKKNVSETIENQYWNSFLEHRELTRSYDNVLILHHNSWNSFVPSALFNVDHMCDYLQFNQKVFDTDSFSFDVLKNFQMTNVFIPFANLNNYLIDQFDVFDFKHSSTILVEKLLELSKNELEKQVYVHIRANSFEIIVAEQQNLILFNSFDIASANDFIYYLLFIVEQLNLSREHLILYFLGEINQDSDYFRLAHKYIRNITMLDITEFQKKNDFDHTTNLKHFILLQS